MYPRSIYKITHIPTGRVYVGSSNVPEHRLASKVSKSGAERPCGSEECGSKSKCRFNGSHQSNSRNQ